ncbi:MAG: hypothetical protein HFI19_01225 [Lachnospiraceae bacterium]|uniref:aminopeptidase P family protein n=1 Tax=Candidatus Merdisoma sp. JLR.KK006 TaxID=3112626 RepID=UPI002FEF14EA|nr:hypothetical protein [Lachnospiraceae bacterium]
MNITTADQIIYGEVKNPEKWIGMEFPEVPKSVYERRIQKVRERMQEEKLDFLFIYADKEHCGNFEYLCGYDPRYEEAALIVPMEGNCHVILGNECYSLHVLSKIPVIPHLYQVFSLPNQPFRESSRLDVILKESGIKKGDRIGVCGWKLFPEHEGTNGYLDIPWYLIKELSNQTEGIHCLTDANGIFIHPRDGLRTVNEAEQISYFEYGAALTSNKMLDALDAMEPGKSGQELAEVLSPMGLPMTSHVMFASGERTAVSLTSPGSRKIQMGDVINFSFSLRGGLTCRAGYAVEEEEQLREDVRDYLEKIVKPYFATAVSWLEQIGIGISGGAMYDLVEKIFPQKKFGWVLNPGHLTGTEEWLASPIYPGSDILLKSGQILQLDIIPDSISPYFTSNLEDGILLADKELREEIRKKYPDMWNRMQKRREYIEQKIGIFMKPEVLPMSNTLGLLRPFFFNKRKAMKKQ